MFLLFSTLFNKIFPVLLVSQCCSSNCCTIVIMVTMLCIEAEQ